MSQDACLNAENEALREEIAGLKRLVRDAHEREDLLLEAQSIARVSSYVLDIPSGIWSGSIELDNILGLGNGSEHSVEDWIGLLHPDDRPMMVAYFRDEVLGKTLNFDKKYRIIRSNDQVERWVHGLGKVKVDDQGRPSKMLGTIQDITEHKRVETVQSFLAHTSGGIREESFIHSLARFLAQVLKVDFVSIDRLEGDGLTARTLALWHNGGFEDNVSYTLKDTPCGDVVGREVRCFPAGVCHVYPQDKLLRGLQAESYAGVTLWGHTGQPIGLIAVIGRAPLSDRSSAELTLKLVAGRAAGELERERSEEALRESNDLFSLFMHYSPIYTFIKEVAPTESRVIHASDNYREMIGISGSEMEGKSMAELFPPEFAAKITADDWAVVSGGKVLKVDEDLNDRNYATIKFPIIRPNKNLLAGYTIDITDRVQAEAREKDLQAKFERAARMESLGVLAGGVAHDLNNVLGPIVALPDLVMEYLERNGDASDPDFPGALESVRMMRTSALRAAGVVSDLVVLGRRGQFPKDPVDINRMVEQMMESKQIRTLQTGHPDVHLSKQLSTEALWCLGSEMRLGRVLANLVGNAAEAIDGNGDVVVKTGRTIFTEPYAGYELIPPGDYVTFEVTDTGCGIDAKLLCRIFEPFFSTKASNERSGSGLGLSVVHGLVRDHGGYLDAKSVVGQGATFTVYLQAIAAGSPVLKAGVLDEPPRGHERILVIDDEPGQRLLVRTHLMRLGYDVTEVSSGEEAVALFEAAHRENQPNPYDLVLSDVLLKGMDGLAACMVIRRFYPMQKFLIMSGHAPGGYEELIKALDGEWLGKPFTAIDLANALRRRLDR